MNKNTPYLSFYQKHNISPVRQDISDISKHFSRRGALYKQLGIIPNLVSQKDVLEFGPGGGFNSIYTASLNPNKYVLVDGNPAGLQSTKELLISHQSSPIDIQIHECDALDFEVNQQFDIVLAEGLVPLQLNPSSFAQNLSRHTKSGGVFVLTTCNSISFFSESIRRLIAALISPVTDPLEKRVSSLLPTFQSHAQSLKGMSRPIEDWLIDTIIIPFEGKLFSLPDAVKALSENFDYYSSSPQFITDWRWYKDINQRPFGFNELAIESYYQFAHYFIDYRCSGNARDKSANLELETLCNSIFEKELCFEQSNNSSIFNEILHETILVAKNIEKELPETCIAINEVIGALKGFSDKANFSKLKNFQLLFGRGMQYSSFLRN